MKYISYFKTNSLIIGVLGAGLGYLLILQWLIPNGTYFNGDAGLNALLSQNLARGNFSFALGFPDQPWIKYLWSDRLFPYQEPFVYELAGKFFITFPYTFPLITAPFYAISGYRGFYVIPVLATLATWVVFLWVCKKLNLSAAAVVMGVALLIFSTNFTIYSAIYSEHTLSVCLSFAGLSFMIPQKDSNRTGLWAVLLAGLFTGLAVWFRPEQILLVIFLDFLALWAVVNPRWPISSIRISTPRIITSIGQFGWAYITASSFTLLIYGLTNWLIYDNFFGMHVIQVIEKKALSVRLMTAVGNFQLMTAGYYSLFIYVPIALLPIGYLFLHWIKPDRFRFDPDWVIWYVFCLAFVIGVSALVPAGAGGKQWGPRFLLLLVPVIILIFAWQFDYLLKSHDKFTKTFGKIGIGLIAILGVIGTFQNSFNGTNFLTSTYAQSRPAVEFLQTESEPVIVISDQYIGQVLQPALSSDKVFLRALNDDQLARLSKGLLSQNQNAFTYICFTGNCPLFGLDKITRQVNHDEARYFVQVVNSGEYGKYTIVKVQVRPSN